MAPPAWREAADHVVVRVRLTPRSALDRVEGTRLLSDGSAVLTARVRALPEDGAANRALIRLLADRLDIPVSAVTVVGGATARIKEVRIAGDPAVLAAELEHLAAKR